VLDSNQKLSIAQKTWLEADLATTHRAWKLVFLHHAPYSCGTLAGNDLIVRNQWGPLFEKYKVDVVFAGHEHTYSRTRPIDDFNASGRPGPDGLSTVYIVEGASGGGGGLSSSCPPMVAKSGWASYVVVNFSGGALRLRAISDKGVVLDTMTLTH
jgi:acid phosphatase type 7